MGFSDGNQPSIGTPWPLTPPFFFWQAGGVLFDRQVLKNQDPVDAMRKELCFLKVAAERCWKWHNWSIYCSLFWCFLIVSCPSSERKYHVWSVSTNISNGFVLLNSLAVSFVYPLGIFCIPSDNVKVYKLELKMAQSKVREYSHFSNGGSFMIFP